MVKSVLCSALGNCPLPIVVYLDDIAIYGDTQERVLEDTLKTIKGLATAGFIFKKLVSPSCSVSSWPSLDLRQLLGAQYHQAYHLAGDISW